ncbi:MAG: VWA domain-containing protein [Erysipelotrichaceae bacterium]|nr:VWA domain-containing protein [Erysipelotrichaceae bacterium]
MNKKQIQTVLQKVCIVLIAALIFLNTYLSMILPTNTLDSDTAAEEPGIGLIEEDNTEKEVTDNNTEAQEEDIIVQDGYDPFAVEEQREAQLNKAAVPVPAEEEVQEIGTEEQAPMYFYDDSTDVIVSVEAPFGAFEEGTEMFVMPVYEEDVIDAVNEALDAGNIADEILAVDISFRYGGEETEPKLPIKVSLSAKIIEEAEDLQIVHIDDRGEASVVERVPEEGGSDEVIFESGSFSTYVVVKTKTVINYVTDNGESYTVTVTFDENEKLYGNESLSVEEIPVGSDEYMSYYAKSAAAMGLTEDEEITQARFFDIKALRDGQVFEPEYPAEVNIVYEDPMKIEDGEFLSIVHFASEGTEVIDTYEIDDTNSELTYKQSSFSVTGTVVAANNIQDGEQYIVYASRDNAYYAISHYSEGRDGDLVYGVEIDGSSQTGATVGSDDYGSSIVWTVHKVTVSGNTYYTLSYEEGGKTYYLRSFGGLMVGADSDFDDNDYKNASRYQWRYSNRRLRNRNNENNENRYLRYSASNNGFKERDNGSSDFYFAKVNSVTPDIANNPEIHFVDEDGNELELVNGRDWESDGNTTPAFLIYDIDGYDYVKTALNGVSGTEIRPILRKSAGKWQYTTSVEQSTSISWSGLSDTDKIYVVYKESTEPKNGGTPKVKESSSTEDPVDPVIHKESVSNRDGTNTIGLSITADTSPLEVEKLADVIVIFDTSTSMRRKMGTSTTTYNNDSTPASQCDPETRIYIAAHQVNVLAEMLIGDETNFKDSAGNKLIRMSLISFNRDAKIEQTFTDNASDFQGKVNALTTSSGTNWEAALDLANHMEVDPERATFVIFVTDGNPSYRLSRGNLLTLDGYPATVSDPNLDVNRANQYYFYRALNYFGALDETDVRNYNTAVTEAKSIVDHKKNLYTIGIGNAAGVSRLQSLTINAYNNESIGKDRTKTAETDEELVNAFSDIAASIVALLGWGDINMSDGITSLTNTVEKSGLVNVDGKFQYWKAKAPEGWSAMSKAERAEFLKTYQPTGFEPWDPATENCDPAQYDEATGSVKWDMGHNFVPESGATYKVTFRVWPSQEAYDILANLKNGTITYDELDDSQKAQIVDHGNGTYSLKTNDKDPSTTYKTARKTGDGVTTTGETKTLRFNNVDPMALVPEKMTVRKDWDYEINDSHAADALKFRLLVDGKYYQNDGTFKESTENAKVLDISDKERTVSGEIIPAWSNSVNIAPGIVKFVDGKAEVYETGHHYQLEEFDITLNGEDASQFAGSYEFTTQTVRPMVLTDEINNYHAKLIYLILADENNPVPEGAQQYTIGENTYFVADANNSVMVGTNHRKAELDITKLIINLSEKPVEELINETFTYRITLNVPADADLSLITGYEYVQRADPNTTLHGYQEGDHPLPGDEERFRGHIFRWATFKYGAQQIGDAFTDLEEGRKTLTIDATLLYNEVLRLTNLPTGTVYTIEEVYANLKRANLTSDAEAVPDLSVESNLAEQGYTVSKILTSATVKTVDLEHNKITGTIDEPDKRYYNQFTNTLGNVIDVELKGTKHLDGYAWSGESYYFNLSGGEGTPLPVIGAYGRVRFFLKESSGNADKTYSFGKIRFDKAGEYVYTISEDNAGTTQTVNGREVLFGDPETVTIKIVADENDNGKLKVASVTGSDNMVWNVDALTATVTITNTSVTKETDVKLKKVDQTGALLSGSEFALYKFVNNAWTPVEGFTQITPGSTEANNPFDLGMLETGRYKLTETKAPDGYIIRIRDTYFEIRNEEQSVTAVLTDADGAPITSEDPAKISREGLGESAYYLITVKNIAGTPLPMTGGIGTQIFRVGGAVLIGVAAMLRKRSDNRSFHKGT